MTGLRTRRSAGPAVSAALYLLLGGHAVAAAPPEAPRLVATFPLPDVRGRLDHLAIDEAGGRLFVAALGNDTVEVLDLRGSAPRRTLAGLHEPQGVLFLPERRQLYVSNGASGVCDVFDADTLARRQAVTLSEDADNLRWDAREAMVYVANGSGALTLIDPSTATVAGSIALPAHPESFQLASSAPRLFVNLPARRAIAVVDRRRRTVTATWPLVDASGNYPMALDEGRRRLLVGTRHPPRIDVYDVDTGRRLAAIPSVGDMDDLFIDSQRDRVYAIGGEGRVDVLAPGAGADYRRLTQIRTRAGARTGLWVPGANRLYVALPRAGGEAAEIRAYDMSR